MKQRKIKAIAFDIGGVLVGGKFSIKKLKRNNSRSVHEYMAKKLDLDLDSWFDSIDSTYADAMEGKISEKETLKILSRNLKISEKKLSVLWINAYKKLMKDNKKLYSYAKKLKEKGYKIAILSDQWYLSEKALAPKDKMKMFDEVVISCDKKVKVRKPHKKIYKILLRKLKLPPEQIVFIDNREWNLPPAEKLNMKTILFKNNKQVFKQLSKLGVEV